MSKLDAILPGIDPGSGGLILPLWLAGALAAVLTGAVLFALLRSRAADAPAALYRVTVLALAACGLWFAAEYWAAEHKISERAALDARSLELTARAIAPGSALACLDSNAGATVEAACEKAVFATPQSTAAATSYIAFRLSILADSISYAASRDSSYETTVGELRRGLEVDPFGLVAHVLATRHDCTADRCAALALLRDPRRVQANLKNQTFEMTVARYAAEWPRSTAPAVSSLSSPATSASARSAGTPLPPGYDLPSAASIPPISIMSGEPSAPPDAAPPASASSVADAESTPEPSPRLPPRRPAPSSSQAGRPAPMQLVPPALSTAPTPRPQ